MAEEKGLDFEDPTNVGNSGLVKELLSASVKEWENTN